MRKYQTHGLINAQHNITQIARLLGRDKSKNSREPSRNAGWRVRRTNLACELATMRPDSSSIANALAH
jgi:IS30 family transposase